MLRRQSVIIGLVGIDQGLVEQIVKYSIKNVCVLTKKERNLSLSILDDAFR